MALRRCSRCECTYHNDDEPCRFHAGRFRGWWTCCKEPLQSAQGCRSGLHIEDAAATAMFDAYEANEKEWDEATYCNQTTPAEFTCLGYALAIPLHPRRAAPRFPLPTEPLRMRHAQPARVAVVG